MNEPRFDYPIINIDPRVKYDWAELPTLNEGPPPFTNSSVAGLYDSGVFKTPVTSTNPFGSGLLGTIAESKFLYRINGKNVYGIPNGGYVVLDDAGNPMSFGNMQGGETQNTIPGKEGGGSGTIPFQSTSQRKFLFEVNGKYVYGLPGGGFEVFDATGKTVPFGNTQLGKVSGTDGNVSKLGVAGKAGPVIAAPPSNGKPPMSEKELYVKQRIDRALGEGNYERIKQTWGDVVEHYLSPEHRFRSEPLTVDGAINAAIRETRFHDAAIAEWREKHGGTEIPQEMWESWYYMSRNEAYQDSQGNPFGVY